MPALLKVVEGEAGEHKCQPRNRPTRKKKQKRVGNEGCAEEWDWGNFLETSRTGVVVWIHGSGGTLVS